MSTDLIPAGSSNAVDEDILAVAKGSAKYFPRMKLCQAQAKEVQKELVERGGHYALILGKDEVVDLGTELSVVVCSGKAKALDFESDPMVTSFDRNSAEFHDIKERSEKSGSGCMYGPEFLLYLPEQDKFVTYFMTGITARKEAQAVHQRLRGSATLSSKLIETKKHSWFGPVCSDLSTPVEMPDTEITTAAIEQFESEKSTVLEKAPEEERVR